MSEIIEATTHDDLGKILKENQTVVVNFSAEAWCVPCQRLAPHYKKAAELSDATFVHVDVDAAPVLTQDYSIMGVPTVMLFKNTEYIGNIKGRTAPKILEEVDNG